MIRFFQCMINAFIIQAVYLLDSTINNNETTISEMPAVQSLALLLEHDDFLRNSKEDLKKI